MVYTFSHRERAKPDLLDLLDLRVGQREDANKKGSLAPNGIGKPG